MKGGEGQRQEETQKAVDLLPGWNADGMICELLHIRLLYLPLLFIMYDIFFQRQFEHLWYHPLIFLGEVTDLVMAAKFNIFNDDLTLTSLMIPHPSLQVFAKR